MTLNCTRVREQGNVAWIVLAAVLVVASIAGTYLFMQGKDKAAATAQTAAVAPAGMATATPAATDPAAADGAAQPQDGPGTYNGIPVREGNPVVAIVDGQPVNRLDVYRFIQTLPPNIQEMPATTVYPIALEQMINARLVQNKADKQDMTTDEAYQAELEIAKQQIARNLFIQREVDKMINEDELRADYKRLIEDAEPIEERKAAHILLETEEKAREIIQKLGEGANFRDVAKAESKDPSVAQNEGELGWFTKQGMVTEFADAAFKLNKGQVSTEPVKTQFGWHVILLEDVRIQEKPSFEQIKPALEMQKRREKLDEIMKDWRADAKVEIFDINGDPVKEGDNTAAAPADAAAPAAP